MCIRDRVKWVYKGKIYNNEADYQKARTPAPRSPDPEPAPVRGGSPTPTPVQEETPVRGGSPTPTPAPAEETGGCEPGTRGCWY